MDEEQTLGISPAASRGPDHGHKSFKHIAGFHAFEVWPVLEILGSLELKVGLEFFQVFVRFNQPF